MYHTSWAGFVCVDRPPKIKLMHIGVNVEQTMINVQTHNREDFSSLNVGLQWSNLPAESIVRKARFWIISMYPVCGEQLHTTKP